MTRSMVASRTADDFGADSFLAMPPPLWFVGVEHDGGVAHRDEVAVGKRMLLRDLRPVHERAVLALEVLDEELPGPLADLAVLPGRVVVGQRHVGLGAAADDGDLL